MNSQSGTRGMAHTNEFDGSSSNKDFGLELVVTLAHPRTVCNAADTDGLWSNSDNELASVFSGVLSPENHI